MGLPFSQQVPPLGPVVVVVTEEDAVALVADPPTGVLVPPPAGVVPVVVAVVEDEGESAPGLSAPADDIAGDVAVVGWVPLTCSNCKIIKKN